LLLISQRSSDQAAKRRYHVSNQDAIRKSIIQAEKLDELLKIQREKSLMQVEPAELAEQTESQQQTDQIKDIRQTKKKPGRPTNPEFTKNKYLEINKEDHRGHRLKDHGLSSHTIIDFETGTNGSPGSSGSSVFSSRYQWNLEVTRYKFSRINCLDCDVLLAPKGGWSIPKASLYGYSIRSLVISWRMSLGISYGDCSKILKSLFSIYEANVADNKLPILPMPIPNKDTMKNWVLQASDTFRPQLTSLHQQIKNSKVLYIDETPILLNGECWFVWVICSENSYYYLLKPSKGLDALKEVIVGCEPMAVVTDDAAVYNAKRLRELLGEDLELQKCIVHIYRVLGKSLRTIISALNKASKTSKKSKKSKKTKAGGELDVLSKYQRKLLAFIPKFLELFSLERRSDAEEGLERLYEDLELPMIGNLKSIWEHRGELFVYKDSKDSKDPKFAGQLQKTNNIAEQGMRIVARMRKRIRCFRSDKCLQAELSILSLYATVFSRKGDFTKFVLYGLRGELSDSFDEFEQSNVPDPPIPLISAD
ncbi:MAG: transposase, partial [Candidatus Heimdallarchaeota archaeon]